MDNFSYDVVKLPSRGIYYKNGKDNLKVKYLVGYDENILTSPNLLNHKDGNVLIDELIKRKVVDEDFDTSELVDEDKDAIMIFLRNTAFGTEYKVTLIDPVDNRPFEHVVDLGELSFKPFTLTKDENGFYEFITPKTNKKIKFTFLNKLEQKRVNELIEQEAKMNAGYVNHVSKVATQPLLSMIRSIDGEVDRHKITEIFENLPIKDVQDFRIFVREHRPGFDLKREATTPHNEKIQFTIGLGEGEFFRPFYRL